MPTCRYNKSMYEFYPYYTNDGSVGLFSKDADDIYHSTYGAITESYEKFIIPAEIKNFLKNNSEIKVLDICFGIGYNSKSLLNEIYNFYYNETIHTNNKIERNDTYNDKIYTNNKKYKILITAIDTDKNLAFLSPFFKTYEKNIGKVNKKLPITFTQKKINKMLSKTANTNFKLSKEINIILLLKLYKFINIGILEILNSKKYSSFFDKDICHFYSFLLNERYNKSPLSYLSVFLHNIYYKYISICYKNAYKCLKTLDFDFNLKIDDARNVIKYDKNSYNFIFLDAFTPSKCPCLWTVDFFKLLYSHLDENGMILTYSNSANIRNAFLNAGFYVGKIFSASSNKFTGTVAVKNKSLIKYDLSEFDLGLIKTRAGIFYRDENLSLDNEAILKAHQIEVENSNLLSSSKYLKLRNKTI